MPDIPQIGTPWPLPPGNWDIPPSRCRMVGEPKHERTLEGYWITTYEFEFIPDDPQPDVVIGDDDV